jgi:hypothetical protein
VPRFSERAHHGLLDWLLRGGSLEAEVYVN